MPDQPTTVPDELAVLRRIVRELDRLNPDAQRRVKFYLADRYSEPETTSDHYAPPIALPNA